MKKLLLILAVLLPFNANAFKINNGWIIFDKGNLVKICDIDHIVQGAYRSKVITKKGDKIKVNNYQDELLEVVINYDCEEK